MSVLIPSVLTSRLPMSGSRCEDDAVDLQFGLGPPQFVKSRDDAVDRGHVRSRERPSRRSRARMARLANTSCGKARSSGG